MCLSDQDLDDMIATPPDVELAAVMKCFCGQDLFFRVPDDVEPEVACHSCGRKFLVEWSAEII